MDIQPIFEFLKELKANNNKEWFHANKLRFDVNRKVFEELVAEVISYLGRNDQSLEGVGPKDCIFRIYRDIRFSKDKTPYKTSFSACIAQGGRKSTKAIRYLHLEPGNTILAGGMYRPDADRLKKIRQEIDYSGGDLRQILNDAGFKRYFDGLRADQLKRPPKGYEADHPDIDLLKYKSYTVFFQVDDPVVLSGSFFDEAMKVYEAMTPFNDFLNEAVA